jgi:hypothetical protein
VPLKKPLALPGGLAYSITGNLSGVSYINYLLKICSTNIFTKRQINMTDLERFFAPGILAQGRSCLTAGKFSLREEPKIIFSKLDGKK